MVMGALSEFPARIRSWRARQGTSCILTLGGTDPRTGNRYVSYETIKGGFGARPGKDGINTICAGISNTMNTPDRGAGDGVPDPAAGVLDRA